MGLVPELRLGRPIGCGGCWWWVSGCEETWATPLLGVTMGVVVEVLLLVLFSVLLRLAGLEVYWARILVRVRFARIRSVVGDPWRDPLAARAREDEEARLLLIRVSTCCSLI